MGAKPAYKDDGPLVRVSVRNSSIIPGGIDARTDFASPPRRIVVVDVVVVKLACRVRISSKGAVTKVAKRRAADPATSGM